MKKQVTTLSCKNFSMDLDAIFSYKTNDTLMPIMMNVTNSMEIVTDENNQFKLQIKNLNEPETANFAVQWAIACKEIGPDAYLDANFHNKESSIDIVGIHPDHIGNLIYDVRTK